MGMNASFAVSNGLAPAEGPRVVPVILDFTATPAEISGDFTIEESTGVVSFVQSVFIDNADNTSPLTLIIDVTGQRIVVPANRQGYFPVFATESFKWTARTAGVFRVGITFANVPMPTAIWATI